MTSITHAVAHKYTLKFGEPWQIGGGGGGGGVGAAQQSFVQGVG